MKTRLMRTSLFAPIFLTLLFVAVGSAFGQLPNPNCIYRIRARHSDKCLEVGGPYNRLNGAPIVQQNCHDGETQKWTFTPIGAGYYKITSKFSGMSMDVFGGIFSAANNVDVQQRDYNGSANQMWKVDDLGDGNYAFIAKHSGRGLNIRGGSTENGAQAIQYDWDESSTNSQFRLTATYCGR